MNHTAFDVLKPFAWLALIAFLVGFGGYLALGQGERAMAKDRPQASAVSAPSSSEWNLEKRI
jgi:hypothetical protein